MKEEFYHSCSFEELIGDEDFRRWVLEPSNQDEVFWEVFLANHPSRKELVLQGRTFLLELKREFERDSLPANEIEKRLKVVKELAKEPMRTSKISALRLGGPVFKVAAAVLVLFLLVFSLWRWNAVQNDLIVFESNFGEQRQLILPDGSEVVLNANSQLSYSPNWQKRNERNVWLEGEAFFKVKSMPDTHTKFRVHSADLVVEVLGTEFNVNSRREQVKVFLEEGKIKLSSEKEEFNELEMEPGDLVEFDSKEKVLQQSQSDAQDHTSWKDGQIYFKAAKLLSVLQRVSDIYGIDFQVKDSVLLSKKVTTRLPLGHPEIVKIALERALELRIQEEENSWTLEAQSPEESND